MQRERIAKTDMSAGRQREAKRSSLLEGRGNFPQFSAVSEEYSQVTIEAVEKVHWESYQH